MVNKVRSKCQTCLDWPHLTCLGLGGGLVEIELILMMMKPVCGLYLKKMAQKPPHGYGTTSDYGMSEHTLSLSRACRSEFDSKCTCVDLTASERYS